MRYTKCDLSIDKVKIDYSTLILATKLAIRYSVEEIEINKKKLNDSIMNDNLSLIYLSEDRILTASKYLSETTELLSSLLGMKERREFEIVNIEKKNLDEKERR